MARYAMSQIRLRLRGAHLGQDMETNWTVGQSFKCCGYEACSAHEQTQQHISELESQIAKPKEQEYEIFPRWTQSTFKIYLLKFFLAFLKKPWTTIPVIQPNTHLDRWRLGRFAGTGGRWLGPRHHSGIDPPLYSMIGTFSTNTLKGFKIGYLDPDPCLCSYSS